LPELLGPPIPELDAHAARIGDALLERLRANEVFREWATEIEGWDLDELLLEASTFNPPAIALIPAGFEVVPDGSNRQTRLETLWEVLFIRHPAMPRSAADRWLSMRLALALWTELERTLGVVYGPATGLYPDGEPLTLAILGMQRTPAVRKLATGLLAQPVRFLLKSILDAATGEAYDG
jgi:hypothetical protein